MPANEEPTALQIHLLGALPQKTAWQRLELLTVSPSGAGPSKPTLLSFPIWMLVYNDLVLSRYSVFTC